MSIETLIHLLDNLSLKCLVQLSSTRLSSSFDTLYDPFPECPLEGDRRRIIGKMFTFDDMFNQEFLIQMACILRYDDLAECLENSKIVHQGTVQEPNQLSVINLL
jgi:hypothetical protein